MVDGNFAGRHSKGEPMAHTLTVGTVVVNFSTTAMVVGFFSAADGAPSEHDGHPILRALTADRRAFLGDKGQAWIADPAQCEPVLDWPAAVVEQWHAERYPAGCPNHCEACITRTGAR